MQLTERIQLRSSPQLSRLCHLAKNLYNLANYHIRQKFINEGHWTRYSELYAILKTTEAYQNLPAQTAQQTIRLLRKNWKAYFKAVKVYKEKPDNFSGEPRIPKYKPKDGFSIVYLLAIFLPLSLETDLSK